MPISFDYDETRALAKQFRELTGRDIKHTQIIEAMATVKGMKGDSLMHMLKNADDHAFKEQPRTEEERVFFEGKGLIDVLRRELSLPHNPLIIVHHMVGVFDLRPAQSSSIFEMGVMRRAVKDALIAKITDPRAIIGFLDSHHFVIAFPHTINIDTVPSLFNAALNFIPRSVSVDNTEFYFSLIGAVADARDTAHLDAALAACKAEIPVDLRPEPDNGHKWHIANNWQ
jgi:hypothetical protein